MIEANDCQVFQQHSGWPFPNLKCMDTSVEQRQPEYFPASLNLSTDMISARSPVSGFTNAGASTNGLMVPPNIIMPDFSCSVTEIPDWKMEQGFEYQGFIQKSFPSFPIFAPPTDVYHRGKPTGFLHRATGKTLNDTFPGSVPKGFLIFDRSVSRTQLISHAMCPSALYPTDFSMKQASDLNLLEKRAIKEGLLGVEQPSIPEELDEKQIDVEESRTHEGTEELNDLLYSDEADDDSFDDDDIISTDHSPSIFQGNYEKVEQFEEIIEEVASSDHQNKRQKQLKGRYMKAPLMNAASSFSLNCSRKLDIDAESNTSRPIRPEEMGNMAGKKRTKNDDIHEMIRVLESIVPGPKGKDPLLVLNESITYLKSLKVEAKALGVYPL